MEILKSWEEREKIKKVLARAEINLVDEEIKQKVEGIIHEVRESGDTALLKYTELFDGVKLSDLKVKPTEVEDVYNLVDKGFLKSLELAANNITNFHKYQPFTSWTKNFEDGVILGQRYQPIESVGIYVPGGRAPYVSTVLMTAIPAKVAGVKKVILCTPPSKEGISPYILAAARLAKVDEVYQVGGAQAIAALAFGTATIPKVDKIVGPGNIYVTLAKRAVYGYVSLDMVAGPTEIAIISDDSGNPQFIAADLLSQAEHDPLSTAIFITTSQDLALKVSKAVETQAKLLLRQEVIQQSLTNSAIVLTKTLDEAIELANEFAPEHLELQVENPGEIVDKIKHAGAIFLGQWSTESVGDYFAGPSHVLPTCKSARFFSPLGIEDFLKRSSIISYTKQALDKYGQEIINIANLEGFDAHAAAVRVRLE
ncbi:MAG: histidinol dehydrogenase [bacterium]|nr:histidinol dehydrogenase [bacterium]